MTATAFLNAGTSCRYSWVSLFQNAPFQPQINNQKMLPPGAIFELKKHQNAFAATGGPLAGLKGATSRLGREGRGGKGRGEKGKGREAFSHFLFQSNHCKWGKPVPTTTRWHTEWDVTGLEPSLSKLSHEKILKWCIMWLSYLKKNNLHNGGKLVLCRKDPYTLYSLEVHPSRTGWSGGPHKNIPVKGWLAEFSRYMSNALGMHRVRTFSLDWLYGLCLISF